MIRPAHGVDTRALGGQRKHRQRIGILTADQTAHRPELGRERAEGVAKAAHMHEALANGRHDLLMLADQAAVGAEIELRVKHGADGLRHFFADTDHHIGIGVARRGPQGGGFRPRDFHRILEQLDGQLVGNRAGRRMMVIPDRMGRNKAFRKSDDAGAIGPRFANQAAGFLRRTSAVEKHRRRLHGGNFDDRVLISWHDQSAQDKPSPTSTFSDLSSMPEALACNNKSWEKS